MNLSPVDEEGQDDRSSDMKGLQGCRRVFGSTFRFRAAAPGAVLVIHLSERTCVLINAIDHKHISRNAVHLQGYSSYTACFLSHVSCA